MALPAIVVAAGKGIMAALPYLIKAGKFIIKELATSALINLAVEAVDYAVTSQEERDRANADIIAYEKFCELLDQQGYEILPENQSAVQHIISSAAMQALAYNSGMSLANSYGVKASDMVNYYHNSSKEDI